MTSNTESNTKLIDRYIAAWNEMDPQKRQDLIAHTWTEDSRYLDPIAHGEGRSGIAAMIEGVQKQCAGVKFRRSSDVDAHHDRLRFQWELAPEGGSAVAGGVDFGITRDGLLQGITGFSLCPSRDSDAWLTLAAGMGGRVILDGLRFRHSGGRLRRRDQGPGSAGCNASRLIFRHR